MDWNQLFYPDTVEQIGKALVALALAGAMLLSVLAMWFGQNPIPAFKLGALLGLLGANYLALGAKDQVLFFLLEGLVAVLVFFGWIINGSVRVHETPEGSSYEKGLPALSGDTPVNRGRLLEGSESRKRLPPPGDGW